jgi:signal transduction histidine kinase
MGYRMPAPMKRLLRLPLYYKLVIANAVITLGAVLACASLVNRAWSSNTESSTRVYVWLVIVIATLVGVFVNSIVVRIALSPVRDLAKAAEAVHAGDENVRAEENPLSDAATADVVTVFNEMLDSLASYRRRLREIAIRAVGAGEAERTRLSQELHDGVAQGLAAVLVQLRVVQRSESGGNAQQLASISEQIASSINELRALAQSLRPPSLDMIGVSAAVRSYARHLTETTGVRAEVSAEGVDNVLPNVSEIALYRIIQDALQNVAQHAGTHHVAIDLARRGDDVVATIIDKGRGFDVAQSMASGALGLFGMHERALYVGGKVVIQSTPGAGTVVSIVIPIGERAHG